MKRLMRLRSCSKGATLVEFALLAPIFFMMMFGIIESSRLLWMQQILDDVAYSTARCVSVDSACVGVQAQRDYAVTLAAHHGIALSREKVMSNAKVTCLGYDNSSEVSISLTFDTPARGVVPGLPEVLEAYSCFPTLS